MPNLSLKQLAEMRNGEAWLTKHFPLPEGYEYTAGYDKNRNCALYQVIEVKSYTVVRGDGDEITAHKCKVNSIPWIDTLYPEGVYKKLKPLIKWELFEYFGIVSESVLKEITNMEVPLSAYHEYLGNFIIDKYNLNYSRVTSSFLVIDERDYPYGTDVLKEMTNTLGQEFGYLYVKTISERDFINKKDIALHVYVNQDPVQFYTVAKLMES